MAAAEPALRLSLVTIGVDDVARAARFYESLGMNRRMRHLDGVAFFDSGGVVFSVFGRAALAKDATLENTGPHFGGIALACNVENEAAVDAMLTRAVEAGGTILKNAQRAFWGGWHGYFTDPDGHVWEVAHNPGFALDERGAVVLPD